MDPDSLDDLERIVQIADRFESKWRRGGRPRIEDYLDKGPSANRPELLHDLLCIELEICRARGESPGVDEYLARFPNDRALIVEAFPAGP